MSVGGCRIRDVVRDLKIRWDIQSQFDRKFEVDYNLQPGFSHYGRVFPRSSQGDEQHYLRYVDFVSSFDETESGFYGYNGKEDPFHGFYHKYGESDSLIGRFKRNIPDFDGFWHIEDLLSWIEAIEDFFEEVSPPEHLKCKIVWYKTKGAAYYWWKQLQDDRNKRGKEEITSWPRMKNMLLKRFSPTMCLTKCPNQQNKREEEEEVVNHPKTDLFAPLKCSTEVLFESYNDKQDGVSDLSSLSVFESIHDDNEGNFGNSAPPETAIEGIELHNLVKGSEIIEGDGEKVLSTQHSKIKDHELSELLEAKMNANSVLTEDMQEGSDSEGAELERDRKVTSVNNRQLPTAVFVLPHPSKLFWESFYASKNEKLKLSHGACINIRLEEVAWLVRVVVGLTLFLDDYRNSTYRVFGDCMVYNHYVDVITLLLFDPDGSHAFQNSWDYPLSNHCILFECEVMSGNYTDAKRFGDLNLSLELLKSLYIKLKLEKPSVIQAETLPIILTLPYGNLMILAFDEADHMVAEDGLQPLNLGLLFHILIPFDPGGIACFLITWNSDFCAHALIELQTKYGEHGIAYMHDNIRLHQGLGPPSVVINTMVERGAAFLVHKLRNLAFSVDVRFLNLVNGNLVDRVSVSVSESLFAFKYVSSKTMLSSHDNYKGKKMSRACGLKGEVKHKLNETIVEPKMFDSCWFLLAHVKNNGILLDYGSLAQNHVGKHFTEALGTVLCCNVVQ